MYMQHRTQNVVPLKGIVGVVGCGCVHFGVRWGCETRGGIQVSDYGVCMSRRWLGGGTALCAVEGRVGGCCGVVENIFLLA
jgi:hypothetical protein